MHQCHQQKTPKNPNQEGGGGSSAERPGSTMGPSKLCLLNAYFTPLLHTSQCVCVCVCDPHIRAREIRAPESRAATKRANSRTQPARRIDACHGPTTSL